MSIIRATLERAWFAVTDLVWPRACLMCDVPITDPAPHCLCPICTAAIATDPYPSCPRCSTTIGPHVDTTAGCPRCRTETYRFTGVNRLGLYDGTLRDAILRIKQPGGEVLAEVLGHVFAEFRRVQLLASAPQVVVPVPLHWRRWAERRHNQAAAVARGIAERLRLPLAAGALRRTRHTERQTVQSVADRRTNVKNAFAPTTLPGVKGVRVLLIDDVLTTGATADAAATALLAAGTAQVHVAVLAHR